MPSELVPNTWTNGGEKIFDARRNLLIDSEGPTGNIGHPSSFEGRRHLRRMLIETKTSITDFEIDEIVSTLGM